MWEQNDLNGYVNATKNNIGQIKNTDMLSHFIKMYCDNMNFKNFLEIGTWNGLGSTKIFADNLINRNDDWIFYSLESNIDKCNDAQKLYENIPNIHILNEVIWNEIPNDLYNIFPEVLLQSVCNEWYITDINNMKLCKKFLDRTNLPEVFDLILFDGGEYTTYHEFQYLKNKTKVVLLDDTNILKCEKIAHFIRNSKEWKIIADIPSDRNGILVAEKI